MSFAPLYNAGLLRKIETAEAILEEKPEGSPEWHEQRGVIAGLKIARADHKWFVDQEAENLRTLEVRRLAIESGARAIEAACEDIILSMKRSAA